MSGEGTLKANAGRLGVLLALGAVLVFLRLRHLDHGLYPDEFGSAWAIHGATLADLVDRVNAIHGQSPLYYLILWFTVGVLGESELTLRLPSLVFGVAVPALGYLSLREAFGRRAAVSALLLLGTHGLLVFQSHEARPYPLSQALALLSVWGASRALRTGRLRDRLLMWGAAVLAIYAHYLVFPLLGALLVGGLHAKSEAYPRKKVVLDGVWVLPALVPAALHMLRLFGRGHELVWQAPIPIWTSLAAIFPGAHWVLLAGLVHWLWRRRGERSPPASSQARGVAAVAWASILLVAALTLALAVNGTPISHGRYTALALLGLALAASLVIARFPAPLAWLALSALCVAGFHALEPNYGPQWREAGQALDALEPAPDEPILLWSGFVESDRLVREPSPFLHGFCASPLADRPGRPHAPRRFLLLTRSWQVDPEQPRYFESELVPALARAESFCVVAHTQYLREFERWLARRFGNAFVGSPPSRSFYLEIRRYRRQPPPRQGD